MGAKDLGRRTARWWTGTLAAAGIALAGLVGIGTVHVLETGSTTSATSGTRTASGSGAASASTGLGAGTGTSQTGSSGS